MSQNEQPVVTAPVTDELLNELGNAQRLIESFEQPDVKLSDKSHYYELVCGLESLAREMLRAQSTGSLVVPKTDGARFSIHPHNPTIVHLNSVVAYLRNDAANLLRHNGEALSKYEVAHVTEVLNLLRKLYTGLLHSIRAQAEADLKTIMAKDPAKLVATATALSGLAVGLMEELTGFPAHS